MSHFKNIWRTVALGAALLLAKPFIGGFESGFQTVQEYSGFIAPGVVAVFLLGFFAKRTNTAGAFAALFASIGVNIALKFGAPDVPFIIRIWIVFLSCIVIAFLASRLTPAPAEDQPVALNDIAFGTRRIFNVLAVAVVVILAGLYILFW